MQMGDSPVPWFKLLTASLKIQRCASPAGLGFVAFEFFLTYGPPHSWLKLGFKANPKLRVDQIDECIRQAKSRLVGALHLLIQVCCLSLPLRGLPYTDGMLVTRNSHLAARNSQLM